jgi:hypothetical protein
MLVDSEDQALILNQGDASVRTKSGYNPVGRVDGFSFRDIDGKPGIVVFCQQIDLSRLLTAYHERFHHEQEALGWDRWSAPGAMSRSPVLPDAGTFVLFMLEQRILSQALQATNRNVELDLLRDYVSVRAQRLAKTAPADIEAELAVETTEGTAQYLENSLYMSWPISQRLPGAFTRVDLAKSLLDPGKAAVYRFRYYQSGAALAHIFDDLAQGWKQRLPRLGSLKSVADELAGKLPAADRQARVSKARQRYHLDKLEASYVAAFEAGKPASELERFLSHGQYQVKICLRKTVRLNGSGHSAMVAVTPQKLLFGSGSRFFTVGDPGYSVTVNGACLLDSEANALLVMETLKPGDLLVDGQPVPLKDGIYGGRLEITGATISARVAAARMIISGNVVTIE